MDRHIFQLEISGNELRALERLAAIWDQSVEEIVVEAIEDLIREVP